MFPTRNSGTWQEGISLPPHLRSHPFLPYAPPNSATEEN
jgi:hypothetical protein